MGSRNKMVREHLRTLFEKKKICMAVNGEDPVLIVPWITHMMDVNVVWSFLTWDSVNFVNENFHNNVHHQASVSWLGLNHDELKIDLG